MTGSPRTSTGIFVEQTTDIINRFRNSLIRNRKERLLDEDVQATDNIVKQLHFTELMAKETLGKLILQGDSMQRSYGLMSQLEKQIKDIAEDLNEVNGGKCFGACTNGTCFGFTCFGCLKKKKKKISRKKPYEHKITTKNQMKKVEQNINSLNENRWNSTTEREEIIARTRALAQQRREHPDFIHKIELINNLKHNQTETNEKKIK